MNITISGVIPQDVSYSNNCHIFGRPIQLSECGVDGYMDIPIIGKDGRRSLEGLGEWIEKTSFLCVKAGIDLHFNYVKEELDG